MKIGFIGLGNVGGKLAGSLLRNKFKLTVRDLDKDHTKEFELDYYYKNNSMNILIVMMLTKPTVIIAINPTTKGL